MIYQYHTLYTAYVHMNEMCAHVCRSAFSCMRMGMGVGMCKCKWAGQRALAYPRRAPFHLVRAFLSVSPPRRTRAAPAKGTLQRIHDLLCNSSGAVLRRNFVSPLVFSGDLSPPWWLRS